MLFYIQESYRVNKFYYNTISRKKIGRAQNTNQLVHKVGKKGNILYSILEMLHLRGVDQKVNTWETYIYCCTNIG